MAKHAGSWYTNHGQELDSEVSQYLEAADVSPEIPPKILKALIGPHAGFAYSGPNAAWAYKNIKDPNQYDTIFILGPSHKVYLDFVATTACDEWETPLGSLTVDKSKVDALVNSTTCKFEKIVKKYEENEHSLEMHLPYVRKQFQERIGENDIKIVPLMVGELSEGNYIKYA